MKTNPYLIDQSVFGTRLRPLDTYAGVYDESWLQELLRKYPDTLPVEEIEPVFAPLIPVGCEVSTEAGFIDNLFISPRGYLTLVETKLWRNPEARREVLAQAIDYAGSISKWSYHQLDEVSRAYTRKYDSAELGMAEWVEHHYGPLEGGKLFFEDTVTKNLRLGRLLTLIVGDRVRQSMIDMLDYVNRFPHLAMDVALVELNCYYWHANEQWPLLVVPALVARTEIVERSVIQVTVDTAGTYQVDVQQEKSEETGRQPKRLTLTEEAYWELLKVNAPECFTSVQRLVDTYRQQDNITIDMSQASLVVRYYLPDSGQKITLFFIDTNAWVSTWPGTISGQLERIGLDRNLTAEYEAEVRKLLHSEKRRQPSSPVLKVNMEAFIAAVDELIGKIQAASE